MGLLFILFIVVFILLIQINNKFFKKETFSNNQKLKHIHIGKCGGGTIKTILKNFNIKHNKYHERNNFKYNKDNKYLISIRNPLSRFISAWNWRKYNICPEKLNVCSDIEKKIYKDYSLNKFLENLYTNIDPKKIKLGHNIPNRISFYLIDNKFLNDYDITTKNIDIITSENLYNDMEKSLGFKINKLKSDIHISTKKEKYEDLSPLAIKNLLKLLDDDYKCIEKLNNLNLLSKEQYKVLSKKSFK